ncbi:hypothetical protein CC77DRAFT_593907 [Alternaria alternata]|uniref:Uncharacterized protein n=1 Tax=Alternaria alternata TaxID=5599 RepID=A0A177D3U7_ALTAL|nr:hypothetical protein CC77DRAFT_593907 [Alternaria alternata]XP_051582605.1 uncharacterized protein J4E82_011425 [Alternaria postmessia]KAI5364454.1 hypothetical protein J4E82_011425 [Alternaria postmessia]OAG13772.1 hypothetical protein CC77DRAFT_593907 [Alternaria alternata]
MTGTGRLQALLCLFEIDMFMGFGTSQASQGCRATKTCNHDKDMRVCRITLQWLTLGALPIFSVPCRLHCPFVSHEMGLHSSQLRHESSPLEVRLQDSLL